MSSSGQLNFDLSDLQVMSLAIECIPCEDRDMGEATETSCDVKEVNDYLRLILQQSVVVVVVVGVQIIT